MEDGDGTSPSRPHETSASDPGDAVPDGPDGGADAEATPPDGDAEATPPADDAEDRRRRRRLVLLLTPLTLAVSAGLVARALFPTLIAKAPVVLIALDPSNLNLVTTASLVDPFPYFAVATIRLFAVDPFTYLLGREYGDAGVRWIEKRFTGLQPTVQMLERLFARVAPLAVALAPGAIMCTLAGAVGMRVWVFALANLAGTVGRIALLRWVGDVFADPVESIRDFFDQYLLLTTAISVGLVLLWVVVERRRGAADAETPAELASELEEAIGRERES